MTNTQTQQPDLLRLEKWLEEVTKLHDTFHLHYNKYQLYVRRCDRTIDIGACMFASRFKLLPEQKQCSICKSMLTPKEKE